MVNNTIKKIKNIYLSLMSTFTLIILNSNLTLASEINTKKEFISAFNNLSTFSKKITNGMLAFSMLSGIGVLIYHAVQLALVGSNPSERSKVLRNLLTSIICMALLGSIGLIMAIILAYSGVTFV